MTSVSSTQETWLRRFQQATPGALTLVCLPHAGGSAPYFLPLARALAPAVDVVSVQYPGRQDRRREPAPESLDTLADQLFDVLDAKPGTPLVLFGHSMGAILAYEVARRMEREADDVPLGVIVSGRRSPSRHRDESVHRRDDAGIIAEMQELSGTDPGIFADEELMQLVLPTLRADYRAVETYRHRPGTPLRAPVSVLTGASDPRVTEEEARAWEEVTTGAFSLRIFPGGHFYLNTRQQEVTAAIKESIAAFKSAAG
ncbi:alpha/beta fold hydrolase [Streptomyces sp. MP131-18]|uniref:thioesterase II family protein n=1 Tax=Streptomyces sp. MP131-18 TaxID=1857892 RepID=UPI00097C610B|nr:alpha/beta fold hydrolase [Streptomyces sp. MP131-18]ONK11286.1 Phenyloxazoline synthase MbtB [Streptomyces sp. MP131-18]